MPTYAYACKACDHRFEEFQSITADALVDCPACGEAQLRRLIGTGGGVIFKGSGFYATDYKGKNGTTSKSDSGDKGSKSETSGSSSSTDKSCGTCGTSGPDVCD